VKTTKKQFKAFKKECQKWIKEFGMLGWRFYFDHFKVNDTTSIAWCCFPDKPEDRVFTLTLNTEIPDYLTDKDILRSAFHEVMEAFIYKIGFLAKARYVQPEEINEEIHTIIRTLESVVYDNA
jgi:hypothetical protein